MQNKFILTDGLKAANLLYSNDPSVWTYFANAPQTDQDKLYAMVAAAYRAYNLKANTVSSMPFALVKQGNKDAAGKPKPTGFKAVDETADGEDFDSSATWENKVGFLPNPQELFRLDVLSYIATNTIYNLKTSDALGYRTKGLYHAVATTFKPVLTPDGTQLDYIERTLGARQPERYKPEDPRLFRAWRLDHTTELLPSPNTEAQAIMSAAGTIYFADMWIRHFYERGGIAPTVIAMKGAVNGSKVETEEKTWKDWVLGLGKRFAWNPARVVNADTLEVKQFGSAVTDLKNNEVYRQAIENIAMATGMPLSLLLANSANYATAKEEKATWFDSDVIPFCNWLAYERNRQIFEPLGLRLEFRPETLDPQQEDETARAQAFSVYGDAFAKFPTYGLWRGMADTLGLEISDSLDKAAQEFYTDKERQAEEVRQQMQGAGVILSPDGKPIPAAQPKDAEGEPVADEQTEEDEEKPKQKPKPPAKFVPSLDQLRELQRWEELAFRKWKRQEGLDFEWRNDTLPEAVYNQIITNLPNAKEETAIKQVFDALRDLPEPEQDSDLKTLARAMERYAEALEKVKQLPAST